MNSISKRKRKKNIFVVVLFTEIYLFLFRVITGYLLIHRVPGLRTLEHLMPNLLVIRGEQLISHYALAIYEAIDMIDVILNDMIYLC